MLEINNFNNFILKDLSFSLKEDENLVILGQNGAGKSTLAKVLCGLLSSSNVKIFNKNLNDLDALKRAKNINYIPPKLSIFDEYITLKEFLELSCFNESNNKKIQELIELLNLQKLQNRCCIDLSSGEKQLLLLASSILHNAKITIFDELTANLDISRLKDVFNILNSNLLNQKIVITHNLDLAYALKFKVLFLKEGKIEFFGLYEEFFSNEVLKKFYNNSILKLDNHLVVNL